MTKPVPVAEKPATKPAAPAPEPVRLSLNEFCMRVSENDRRVALIGAFEFEERQSGRMQDTEVAYKARFKAFISKPA